MYTLDFETEAIEPGSPHPPRPVGLAYIAPGGYQDYLAFGHPTKNDSTALAAEHMLREAWDGPMLFHNAKFDVAVAMHWFRLPYPKNPLLVHDSMFLAYLEDPRRSSLHLKDLAHTELGMPPDEQMELRDWLFANVKGAKSAKKNWGKHISKAPGDLVGRYAVGDVVRTKALFDHLEPIVIGELGMREAYQREQELLPVILDIEARGVPIAPSVQDEYVTQEDRFVRLEQFIHRKVGDIKIGHGPTLYKAMLKNKLVNEKRVNRTKLGNPMTGRDQVQIWCKDPKLVQALELRSRLVKVIGTYLRPWAEAQAAYGRFYPYFNQTRNPDDMGTRTGRLSSNFQQVPRKPEEGVDVPFLRNFIIPEKGHILNARDYSSQEVRILAHYAGGKLLKQYNEDPDLDVHQWVRDLIFTTTKLDLDRSPVKQANFLQIYGGGAPALSRNIPCELELAEKILKAHRRALPEIKDLSQRLKNQLLRDELVETWGGRLYDVETGYNAHSDRIESLYYKMVNVKIQGSAADQTKQLMIDYYNHPDRTGDILLQVHDELITTVPKSGQRSDMCLLRELMNDGAYWDVPMRSDGKFGLTWGGAKKWEDAKCKRAR